MKMDLGETYEFTLVTGVRKMIKVVGSSKVGDGLELEVDGVHGEFADLQSALGDCFIHVHKHFPKF
jgi:hypothetical protein